MRREAEFSFHDNCVGGDGGVRKPCPRPINAPALDGSGTTAYGLRRGTLEILPAHAEAVTIATQQPPNHAWEAPLFRL